MVHHITLIKQGEILESTLRTALRIMEERRNLLKKMENDNAKKRPVQNGRQLC